MINLLLVIYFSAWLNCMLCTLIFHWYASLSILSLPVHEHRLSFHLPVLYLILSPTFCCFQCTCLPPPWLSLFLSILFFLSNSFWGSCKWDYFLNFLFGIHCYYVEMHFFFSFGNWFLDIDLVSCNIDEFIYSKS